MNRTLVNAYLIFAWLFLLAVAVQVLFAGLVVVARQMNWDLHIGFGHALGLPILVMLVIMYIAKLPTRMKRLTWLLFGVYFVQADVIIFMRDSLPYVSAFHPVLALFDVVIAWNLITSANAVLKTPRSVTKEPIQLRSPAK